jgi:hypothetical protein
MDARVAVVLDWHDALNAGDLGRLAALVDPGVEVGGPRGAARGVAVLHDWVERTGIRLEPDRLYRRDDVVVVEQRATWRSPDTGLPGETRQIASAFLVTDGVVWRVIRYDDLAQALAASGLSEADEAHQSAESRLCPP